MTSYDALVIILSSTLALLLILLIIATVYVIKVLRNVRKITQKAESVADKVENMSSFFEKSAAPIAIGQMIAHFTGAFNKAKNSKNKRSNKDD